jgi:hypothetical protein
MDQRPFYGRRLLRNAVSLPQQVSGVGKVRVGIVMNGAERLAFANCVADFLMQHQADSGVDDVFFLFSAATQYQAGDSYLFTLNTENESGRWALKRRPVLGMRQTLGMVDDQRVALLLRDDVAKFV